MKTMNKLVAHDQLPTDGEACFMVGMPIPPQNSKKNPLFDVDKDVAWFCYNVIDGRSYYCFVVQYNGSTTGIKMSEETFTRVSRVRDIDALPISYALSSVDKIEPYDAGLTVGDVRRARSITDFWFRASVCGTDDHRWYVNDKGAVGASSAAGGLYDRHDDIPKIVFDGIMKARFAGEHRVEVTPVMLTDVYG
jgi:hypothetical protein